MPIDYYKNWSDNFFTLYIVLLVSFSIGCSSNSTFSFGRRLTLAKQAEELRSAGKLDESIKHYLLHIQARLADSKRPKDENPYFYQLLIGDIYLEKNEPDSAKKSYLLALKEKVAIELAIDRLRNLGQWYEEHNQFENAINLLNEFRELDPLLFDIDIDRIHKKMLAEEDSKVNDSTK